MAYRAEQIELTVHVDYLGNPGIITSLFMDHWKGETQVFIASLENSFTGMKTP
jgi:hypothetical protein